MNPKSEIRNPKCLLPLWLFCTGLASGLLCASDDVVMRAMQDEMARSMKTLHLESLPKPYFISYRIQDTTQQVVSASFGALLANDEDHTRRLTVEVRVGDYRLDNSNFSSPFLGQVAQIPVDDDYDGLRRQLWLTTDAAYKRAVEELARKKAALQAARLADDTPDFSREEPTRINDGQPAAKLDMGQAKQMVCRLSALARAMPTVESLKVILSVQNTHTLYVNSEGTQFTRTEPVVSLLAFANAQAPDGMPLLNYEPAYGHSVRDLPGEEEFARRIRKMGEDVNHQQAAPTLDLYNGPVLLETVASAQYFSQMFAAKLLGRRRPLSQATQAEASYLDKIGSRVLPEFLSVVDDPTQSGDDETRLLGGYKVDDDGVRARPTKLVEAGYLKTLLTTRDPVRGLNASSGNNRSGSMPSNLIVTADKGLTPERIKEQLIQLVKKRGKEYGILVDREGFPYKVYQDGHQVMVRNAEMPSLNADAYKDVLAATSAPGIFNAVYDTASGSHLVSFAVPSLLFEDLTVRKPTGEIPALPFIKNPFFGENSDK
jgi:hypothetical protein